MVAVSEMTTTQGTTMPTFEQVNSLFVSRLAIPTTPRLFTHGTRCSESDGCVQCT
jgi:hypothetical protein